MSLWRRRQDYSDTIIRRHARLTGPDRRDVCDDSSVVLRLIRNLLHHQFQLSEQF